MKSNSAFIKLMQARLSGLLLCLLVLFSFEFPVARAADFSEDQIKAVFLFNFANFIRWPDSAFADPKSPFRYCAVNDESKTVVILKKVIEGETAKGRSLTFHKISGVKDLVDCQVLFLQADQKDRFADLIITAADHDILTVSDAPEFADHGGMITLTRQVKRLRPTINIQNIEKTGLKVSAKLLRIASIVGEK